MRKVYIVGISILLVAVVSIVTIIIQSGLGRDQDESQVKQPVAQKVVEEEKTSQVAKESTGSSKTKTSSKSSAATATTNKVNETSVQFNKNNIVTTNPKSVKIEIPAGAVYQKSCNAERCIIYIWE